MTVEAEADRRTLVSEAALVVGIAVGLSAARSVLDFVLSASTPGPLSAKATTLNASAAPGHPWIDLGFQLLFVLGMALPVLLALHLAARSGLTRADVGLGTDHWRRDSAIGLAIAAVIGGAGLLAYLGSHLAGSSLTVVPS